MPISGDEYPFTQEYIDKSPTNNGVYALYDESTTIYIGQAVGVNGIKEHLKRHKRGDEGTCTKEASLYRSEVCGNPPTREKQLLEEYIRVNGKLPRCNNVMP
jgi:hypothetical protein